MNEKFINNTSQLIINDEGIIYRNDTLKQNLFYPYGSISEFKVGFMGVSIKGGSYTSPYVPVGDQKKKLKDLVPTVLLLNGKAPHCTPRMATEEKAQEKKLEKNMQSILNYFAPFKPKEEDLYFEGIATMFSSMEPSEKLLHGCRGDILYINSLRTTSPYANDFRQSVVDPIILITDKKGYYAGKDGDGINSFLKTGSFDLKDVDDITITPKTFTTPAVLHFMVNIDTYELTALKGIEEIKKNLEAGVKEVGAKVLDVNKVYGTATVQGVRSNVAQSQTTSSAIEEIKQFKELLDSGIITQEEFDAKKKQLLGL